MVGQTRELFETPANNVVNWLGNNPYYIQMKTGTSNIAPGMLVRGSTDIAYDMTGSGNPIGYALYAESPDENQKSDYTSAFAKGKVIAVVPLGYPCLILAFCGTIAAGRVGCLLKADGTTAGGVSPMVKILSGSQVIQQKIAGRALQEASSGAGQRKMIMNSM